MKNIKEVAPFLADDFIDLDESIFDADNYSVFLEEKSEKLGILKKYLICKFHDSSIVNISQNINRFSIKISDFSTHVFADAIIEKFNLTINHEDLLFPLSIEFKGNLKVNYFEVDENGFLHEIAPTILDEYLYEQVTKIEDDKIEIVFHFWKSNADEDKHGERVIVIVSASEISVVEEQEKAWLDLFGKEYDNYYEYFKSQFNSERYVSDYSECMKLIKEFDDKNK